MALSRLKSFLPATLAFLLAILISIGLAALSVNVIEGSSERGVRAALHTQGAVWADVQTDGLQVILTGTAPTEATRFRALSIAGTVVDSARVIDGMEVEAPASIEAPHFSVEILRNDAGISLIGLIPLSTGRENIISRVERASPGAPVADLLDVADFPQPKNWDEALNFSLKALALLPRSKISVSADQVEVTATSDSARQKRSFEQELAAAKPRNVPIMVDISAPRPVITPFTLRFLIDESGARFDACSVATEEGRAQIEKAAIDAGMKSAFSCTIGLGVPSKNWGQAVATGIAALAELGQGTITYSDADVTLVAAETTSAADFDRITGELEADLPDVFSLHSVLLKPEVEQAAGNEGPVQFTATLSPEGQVQLRGRVIDERTRVAVESYARSRFGTDQVYGAMRLDENLPTGWSVRVLAGLEALTYLNNGAVIAQPDLVEVRGVTGDPEASAEISRILSAKLGEAENYSIDVTYEETLDPVANLPTPETCVARINTILAEHKIIFAPGSTSLDADGLQTVSLIADVMKECAQVPMEIGGHTDSQGREEMNQQLSQLRAEAVLNALLARRVLTSNLTARGYGEAEPIGDNGTEEGREANRRIEFKLIVPEEEEQATDETGETAAPQADAGNTDAADAPATGTEETAEGSSEQN